MTALSSILVFMVEPSHGFAERLTTDIYSADFDWTPGHRKPGQRVA